jgi:hypothetical protein
MRTNVIITDDFYNNPYEVRDFALQQEFNVVGNFPGKRTKSFIWPSVKETIQRILNLKVTNWMEHDYSGAFQAVVKNETTWIHTDHFNMWAGVCYLTPDAPHECGTGLYVHKPTKSITKITKDANESLNEKEFELHDVIGNRFNRLVLYRSDIYHTSLGYFGDNVNNCRLFQVFFFDTEY